MWMRMALVSVMLAGCMDDPTAEPPDAPPPNSIDVPIGEHCSVRQGLVCGAGVLGACIDDTCVPQCSAVDYPRCRAGLTERHVPIDANTMVCVCD